MPQMACLNWILLFLYFSFILYIFISLIYFLYTPSIKDSSVTGKSEGGYLDSLFKYWSLWV